jgi:hypothetical protein
MEPRKRKQQKLSSPICTIALPLQGHDAYNVGEVIDNSTRFSPSQLEPLPGMPNSNIRVGRHLGSSTGMAALHLPSSQLCDEGHATFETKRLREHALETRTATTPSVRGSIWHASSPDLHTQPMPSSGQWNHEKKEHQRSQKRAFASLKDNPFSRFKHDPNDSETQLELLSSRSPKAPDDSIIPRESLQMLDAAYRETQSSFARGVPLQDNTHRRGAPRRSFGSRSLPAGRDLLSLKAEEASMYCSTVRATPGHRQSSFHQDASRYPTLASSPRNELDNYQIPKVQVNSASGGWLADEYEDQRFGPHLYTHTYQGGFAPNGFDQIDSSWHNAPPIQPHARWFNPYAVSEYGMPMIQHPETPLQYHVQETSFDSGLDFHIPHPNDSGTFGF